MSKKPHGPSAPNSAWFPKGRSGNPKGRPRGSRVTTASAFEVLVDKTLTVPHRGGTREITLEEALEQRTYQDALAGKGMAMREVMKWIRKRDAWLAKHQMIPTTRTPHWCFLASPHRIPPVRILAPIGLSLSLSHGRFRLRSAAGEAANVCPRTRLKRCGAVRGIRIGYAGPGEREDDVPRRRC